MRMMTQVAAAAAGSWAAAAEAPDWGMHLGEGVTAAAAVMAMRPEAVAMRAAAAPEAAVVAGRAGSGLLQRSIEVLAAIRARLRRVPVHMLTRAPLIHSNLQLLTRTVEPSPSTV